MLELARRLDCHKNVVVGYRNSQTFLKEDFEAVADTDVYIATEDGSVGTKGNVLDAVKQEKVEADVIFACGPTPMPVSYTHLISGYCQSCTSGEWWTW